jgi:hypothetical protein
MTKEIVTSDGEVIQTGVALTDTRLAVDLARAEIDGQIATAKQYPRSIQRVTGNILSLATLDVQAAEECMYALPRGGKPVVGPSIRLAEIVAGQWGNCRVGARVVDTNRDEKYVEAEGVFHDLETNTASKATVRRRIVDSRGKIYNDDMIIVTGNAACSIARRNAILAGVPKAVWRKAYEAAEGAVKGDIKTLAERRAGMFKAFAAFGVKPEQIYGLMEVAGEDEITLDHIPTLTGMYQSLKNGEATVEQMFDPRKIGATHKTVSDPLGDDDAPAPASAMRGKTPLATAQPAAETTASEAPSTTAAPAPREADPALPEDTGVLPTSAYIDGKAARKRGLRNVAPASMTDDDDRNDWTAGWLDQDAAMANGRA